MSDEKPTKPIKVREYKTHPHNVRCRENYHLYYSNPENKLKKKIYYMMKVYNITEEDFEGETDLIGKLKITQRKISEVKTERDIKKLLSI
jgi:hypothetical protein